MTTFVVANLGDAALTLPSATVNSGGTLGTGGFIFVNNTTGGPITLTLSASMTPFVMLKDIAGNANAHPITISYSGGIDAGTAIQLTVPYEWVWLAWNGASYSIIG